MINIDLINLDSLLNGLKEKTFAIYNLGCRTNQAETLQISALLEDLGFFPSPNPALILVNTCAVTQKAVAESRRLVKTLRQKFPEARIIAMGCGVDYRKDGFSSSDIVWSNEWKEFLLSGYAHPYSRDKRHPFSRSGRFFLRIQSGCCQFCSFCIVPHLRKDMTSLSIEKAVNLIRKAEAKGYQEVVLVGTNLELYGYEEKHSLSDLVEEILQETRISRISFGSINYGAFDDKFIKLLHQDWKDNKVGRISRFFHIPLQSGSNRILKLMNRTYTFEEFRDLVARVYHAAPFVSIGTDIIVGFPGETEEDFEKTVEAVSSLPFSRLHVFRYNPRRGTPAFVMERKWGIVGKEEKKKRSEIIRKIGKQKRERFFLDMKGKTFPVLFLEKTGNSDWDGLTDNYFSVTISSKQSLLGKIKQIEVR
jgi:threonylcarbamoyladenosine tRNA methylthiotransferase MtaB